MHGDRESHLARLYEGVLDRHGDHRTLYFEDTWYTFGDLHERSTRAAAGLRAAGVGPGDRVVVIMVNCPEVHVAYAAIWRAGAVVTPVVFLVTAPELARILTDSGAVAVLTTPEIRPKVEAAIATLAVAPRVFTVGETFTALEAHVPLPVTDRSADDLAALMYTGGTTGRSKGVALTHANLSSAGASSRAVSHVPGLTRGISGLPLSHAFGLLVTVGNLHAPEPLESILLRWFEPTEYLRLAGTLGAQTTAVVPSMLAILLRAPIEEYTPALRYAFSGGAPLPRAVATEFERRVPGCTVMEGYGCTETGGIISSSPPLAPRRGTVGKPVPGVEVRIEDPAGRVLPAGTDGEIVVRGANVMTGYWHHDPIPDGWFHTGDVGRLDTDGYLTIVDRIKDLIIRGGFNVYPRDVEDVLTAHPAVAMAAVIGRPDERLGEEVVAFVELAPGATATPSELVAFAKERLAGPKYPRVVHIVDAIPLTSVGKLDRKRLRAS